MSEKTFPSCSGPCDQGRKVCPCPEACRKPDNGIVAGPFIVPLVVLAVIGLVSVVARFL